MKSLRTRARRPRTPNEVALVFGFGISVACTQVHCFGAAPIVEGCTPSVAAVNDRKGIKVRGTAEFNKLVARCRAWLVEKGRKSDFSRPLLSFGYVEFMGNGTIRVTAFEPVMEEAIEGRRGVLGGSRSGKTLSNLSNRVTEVVEIEKIEGEMSHVIGMVERIGDKAEKSKRGDLSLDSIEVNLELNAKGEVSILGSGVEVGGSGGVKLTFKRSS